VRMHARIHMYIEKDTTVVGVVQRWGRVYARTNAVLSAHTSSEEKESTTLGMQ